MIEKLIAEFPSDEELEQKWEAGKAKKIAEYTEHIPGHAVGFLGWKPSREEPRPDVAAAKIAAEYPNGAKDYLKAFHLDGAEACDLCNKVNMLIDAVNKLTENYEKSLSGN